MTRLPRIFKSLLFTSKKSLVFGIILLAALIAVLENSSHISNYSPFASGPGSRSNCDTLLKYGHYLNDVDENPSHWQPDGCVLKKYGPGDLAKCFSPGDEIYFLGDSTARQVFWGVSTLLFYRRFPLKGAHHSLEYSQDGLTLNFIWDRHLSEEAANLTSHVAQQGLKAQEKKKALKQTKNSTATGNPKSYIYATVGPWHAAFFNPKKYTTKYHHHVSKFLEDIDNQVDGAFEKVYFAPPFVPLYEYLAPYRAKTMLPYKYGNMTAEADELFHYPRTKEAVSSLTNPIQYKGGARTKSGNSTDISSYYVPVFQQLSSEWHRSAFDEMGVHYAHQGFLTQANILLNHMCNEKLAQESLIEGGTCCAPYIDRKGNFTLSGLVSRLLVVVPVFLFASVLFSSSKVALQYSLFVVGALSVVALWAHISNETHLISKTELFFSAPEFWGLLQAWAASIAVSYFWATPSPASGFYFLSEWQGICVSLYVLLQYSGITTVLGVFDGEVCARLLLSTWLLLQVYEFTLSSSSLLLLLDSASLPALYAQLVVPTSRALARALALPLLLSSSVTDVVRENPPNSPAPSYTDAAAKLGFAIILGFLLLPPIFYFKESTLKVYPLSKSVVTTTSLEKEGDEEEEECVSLKSAIQKMGFPTVFLFAAALMVRTIGLFLQYSVFFVSFERVAETVFADYWVMVLGLWVALAHKLRVIPEKMKVTRALVVFVGFLLVATVTCVHYRLAFYFPGDSFEQLSQPSSLAQVDLSIYREMLSHRGKTYGSLTHLLLVAIFSFSYLVIRLGVMQITSSDQAPPTFSPVLVAVAEVGYEMLLLYPYTLLSVGGTVRLNYFPTGIAHSSLVTRSFGYVDESYQFPYLWWRGVGKLSKVAVMAVAAGVFWVLSYLSASVWTIFWPTLELQEEHEYSEKVYEV